MPGCPTQDAHEQNSTRIQTIKNQQFSSHILILIRHYAHYVSFFCFARLDGEITQLSNNWKWHAVVERKRSGLILIQPSIQWWHDVDNETGR